MFARTFSRRPQPSPPSVAPRFAVQRFIQPKLTVGPVGDPFERERSAADEGLEEQEAEAVGLERVRHGFVPTLPPRAPGESTPSPPVPGNGSLGSRILRQELARQLVPPILQTKLARAGDSDQRQSLRESDKAMRSAAAEGVRTPAVTLPFLDRIQASFGHQSVGHVRAHTGPEASQASRAMNALAFASGDHVVFGGTPNLRTAAHEAAHIVQQRAGVKLAGGIGREGDAFERHADAVAEAVVAGRSAVGLLEPFASEIDRPQNETLHVMRPTLNKGNANIQLAGGKSKKYKSSHAAYVEALSSSLFIGDDFLENHIKRHDKLKVSEVAYAQSEADRRNLPKQTTLFVDKKGLSDLREEIQEKNASKYFYKKIVKGGGVPAGVFFESDMEFRFVTIEQSKQPVEGFCRIEFTTKNLSIGSPDRTPLYYINHLEGVIQTGILGGDEATETESESESESEYSTYEDGGDSIEQSAEME